MNLRVLVVFSLLVGTVRAADITFDFTGTVTVVDPTLQSDFAVGDAISGSYTFSPSLPNQDPTDPTSGIYDADTSYSVTAGSFVSTGTDYEFNIFAGLQLGPNLYRDQYRAALGQTGQAVNGETYNGFSLDLFSNSASPVPTSLTSDALPTTPPTISDFEFNQLRFYFLPTGGGVDHVIGSVDSLTLEYQATPEPSCLSLIAEVYVLLGGLRLVRRFRELLVRG